MPERQGILGSKTYRSINGKVLKTTRLCFCDSCGYRLDADKPLALCRACGRKLCLSDLCVFEYERKHYCEDHIQEVLPLSVSGFVVLRCILEEVNPWKASEFAHMTHNACRETLKELLGAGYIERRGISLWTSYRALDRGILAWKTYAPAHGHDGSVAHFESKLADHLQEREAKSCRQESRLRK